MDSQINKADSVSLFDIVHKGAFDCIPKDVIPFVMAYLYFGKRISDSLERLKAVKQTILLRLM